MKIIFLIISFFQFSLNISAQVIVSGSVKDKTSNLPIEFATIQLIRLPDTLTASETATDRKGTFSFENVDGGTFLVRCSFIGYEVFQTSSFTVDTNSAKYNVGQLGLERLSKTLQEVTVTGRRTMLNTGIDRKIYNVEQDIMSRTGTASDVLRNIPSVEVDIEGEVSLRGSAGVIILINGKPSPLMGRSRAEVLQQLPANSIERIEVITNPSARYRPDGSSGIINIVMKKNIKNGFNGNVITGIGNHDRYNGNITLNYRPKKINVTGSYSFRHDSRNRINNVDRTYYDSVDGSINNFYTQIRNLFARPLSHLLNAGIEYTMDEKNNWGLSGSNFFRKMTRDERTNYSWFNSDKVLTESYQRLGFGPESEKEYSWEAFFEHLFAKDDHGIRFELTLSKDEEVEDNHFTNIYQLPSKENSFDNTMIRSKEHENQFAIDYTNPLTEDSRLEAGYDGSYNKVDLDFLGEYFDTTQNRFLKDIVRSNHFVYHDGIHAIYSTYQKSLEKWSYSVGLRAEQVFIRSQLITRDSTVRNNYFKLYPTLHVAFNPKEENEFQLNYSKRVNRPDGDDLNPFPEYQDPRNLFAGNPKLLPEIIHSVELGYKWQNKKISLVPSFYYRYKKNGFTTVTIPLNDSTLLTTRENLSNDHSAGFELIFSAKAGSWFTTNLSSNLFYTRIDAGNLGYSQQRSLVSMSSNVNTNFILGKTTFLQLSANYRSARLTAQGKVRGTFVFNMGIRQDLFRNKVSLTLTSSDLFASLKQRSELKTSFLDQYSLSKRDGRVVYLSLSYRFGVVKKEKEEKLQFDDDL